MPEKILTYILLPPGGIVLLIFLGLFLVWKKKKAGWALLLASAFLLYLLSLPPVADILLYPLERPYFETPKANAQAIVVLGGGSYRRCGDSFCLTESSLKRVLKAYLLWRESGLPILVSGGRLRESFPTEAEKMEALLHQLGVREVLREEKAINTRGEAREVGKLLKERGWNRIYLVTSAFHMKRALFAFRSRGIGAIPAATDFRSEMGGFPLLPNSKALDNSFIALHEYLGIVYYRLRAWLLPGSAP